MEYFRYAVYFILVHLVLTFVYRGYIYYLYKEYNIRFRHQSAFFSLVRGEIKDNITEVRGNSKATRGLQRLLILHTILSITGKIILAMTILIIIMFALAMKVQD